uniref:Reverse transcriptase Ty1/copia-type domain-containing protein n=1 Tax=Physcomitrium patens TaxID=3218 RepID=A0A2K1JIB2_PHYPA|nr:hypothetical protein PHYPA_018439 [Physcomitrium patens]
MCQKPIAFSNTKAKYMAMVTIASKVVWLHYLLHNLLQDLIHPTLIQCDNQYALALIYTTKFHASTKHIVMQYDFMHQLGAVNNFHFIHCSTHKMHATILTKPSSSPKPTQHLTMLDMFGGDVPPSTNIR